MDDVVEEAQVHVKAKGNPLDDLEETDEGSKGLWRGWRRAK